MMLDTPEDADPALGGQQLISSADCPFLSFYSALTRTYLVSTQGLWADINACDSAVWRIYASTKMVILVTSFGTETGIGRT